LAGLDSTQTDGVSAVETLEKSVDKLREAGTTPNTHVIIGGKCFDRLCDT